MGELTRLPGSKIPMQMFQERISLWLTPGRRRLGSGSLSPARRSRLNRFQQRRTRCLLREQRTDFTLIIGSSPVSSANRRSEEHTSELQSRGHLVCRLLLEKKK